MESQEFIHLKKLIKNGEAKFTISKFFVRKSLWLWVSYESNMVVLLLYIFFNFLQGWVGILLFICLAWILHAWWLIPIGILLSLVIDCVMKFIVYYFLPDSILRDEKLLNYIWQQNPPHVTIEGTNGSMVFIHPPHHWQEFIYQFHKENTL